MHLPGFTHFEFEAQGIRHRVYERGRGPAVLLMHELPGMTPACVQLAERLAGEGFTVFMPLLFGEPNTVAPARYTLQVCISREFYLLARRRSSPITHWLRALCRELHTRCGGPGVGAIGMCLTGGFALALLIDPVVMAPVLSQPSLPVGLSSAAKSALGLSPADLATVQQRVQAEAIPVVGLRFTGDRLCPAARFDALQALLGDRFQRIELDSAPGNPHHIQPHAHSVLAGDFVDQPNHPTRQAYAAVVACLRQQLTL